MTKGKRTKLAFLIANIVAFLLMAYACCGQSFQSVQRMEDADCNRYIVSYVHGALSIAKATAYADKNQFSYRSKQIWSARKGRIKYLSFKDGKNVISVHYDARMEVVITPSLTLYSI